MLDADGEMVTPLFNRVLPETRVDVTQVEGCAERIQAEKSKPTPNFDGYQARSSGTWNCA